jgi:cystathionine gamma-synthase
MPDTPSSSFATRAVHAGERQPPGSYTPVVTPIHPSVGFTYPIMAELDGVFAGTHPGFVYPRYGSPTVAAFESAVAELEGGHAAQAYSSGMAAVHAALLAAGLQPGATLVAALDVYGATYALANHLAGLQGAQITWVDITDLSAVEAALAGAEKPILLAETISNPLLKVAAVPELAALARRTGAAFLLDHTFATPWLLTPLALGVDYLIHSATKYLAGHGDVMAGVVVAGEANHQRLYELNKLYGSVLGPFDAWLGLRGLKTLALRFPRQCANALALAEFLAGHPRIRLVNYPGLPGHPQHDLARSLFSGRGFGAMLSFELAADSQAAASQEDAFRFMQSLRLCQSATTLGDVYTLVLHPATSSHRPLTPQERAKVGISDGLVRLSAGIEDPADLIADLDQALNQES